MTKMYVPLTAAAKLLAIPYYLAKKATEQGAFPQPDASISEIKGWDSERIVAFGIEKGLLFPDGTRSDTKRSWEQAPINVKWMRTPVTYLGKSEVAKIVGLEPETLYIRHNKGQFVAPAIYVGRAAGWAEHTVTRWAAQMGMLST